MLLTAQGDAGAQVFPADPPSDRVLEDVLVTAQKRAQLSQDVPMAVSALGDDAMRQAGVGDIFDVARRVPSLGVQVIRNPLHAQYRLRGLGNLGTIPNFEPDVAYFSDGAFRSRSGLGLGDFSDLDRVEILKGPQSTLYGKNATVGVVAVYTREPGREMQVTGEATASHAKSAGKAEMWMAKGAISGPASDSLRLGVSAVYYDQGFMSRDPRTGAGSNEMQRHALRGQAVFEPNAAFKVRLIAAHSEIPGSKGTHEPDMFYGTVPAALNEAFEVPCPDDNPTNRRVCRSFASEVTLDANEATLIVSYRFGGDYELTSLTSWDDYEMTQRVDADQLNVALLDFNDRQAGKAIQQEVRMASPAIGAFQWITGAFYYDNDFERGSMDGHDLFVLGPAAPLVPLASGVPFGEPGDGGDFQSRNRTEYVGVYAQTTWNVTKRFAVTAGARWQTESKNTTVTHSLNHATPSLISIAIMPATVDADLSREQDAVTWSLTPQFAFTDGVMAYLTASRGFKSGGFYGDWGRVLPTEREFDDEEVAHYELGLKGEFAEHRVQLNAAAFHSDFTDYQDAGFVALQFLVANADAVRSKGLELDLTAQLSDDLLAEFNATYAETRYDKFVDGLCYPGRAPTSVANGTCDLSGAALANAPRLRAHFGFAYDRPVPFGSIYARADFTWSDDYFTNVNHDPRQVQDAFGLVDARLGLRVGSWDLSVWGENLTGETYVDQSAVSVLFGSDPAFQTFIAPGQSYGLTASYRN